MFEKLAERIGPLDSLFVYYAGHGYLDSSETGFWIPVDGGLDRLAQDRWLANQQIRNYLTRIKARAVLLVADACFSGDFLKVSRGAVPDLNVEYFRKSLRYQARQVLSSGASESVPDESEFARQFQKLLETSQEPYLDPITVFDYVRRGVRTTLPLMGSLPGHQEGGSFILYLQPTGRTVVPEPTAIATGTLEIAAPGGSAIELNGRENFVVPADGRLKLEDLAVGKHWVQLRGEYLRSPPIEASVSAGKTNAVAPAYELLGRFTYTAHAPVLVELTGPAQDSVPVRLQGVAGVAMLESGEYQLRASRPEDLDFTWSGKTLVEGGKTSATVIPDAALAWSVAWRLREAETETAGLRTRYERAKASRKISNTLRTGGFLAGGTGAIASCIFWFLGSAAMRDYEAASSSDAAVSARQAASQYSTLCSVSLAATGSGLATGGAALILTPDLDAIARDLDAGLQKLAELESEKERLK